MTLIHMTWFDELAIRNFIEAGRVLEDAKEINILVSYAYSKTWKDQQQALVYNQWMLDSGAYSAFAKGAVIEIEEYLDYCLSVLQDSKQNGIFVLDNIQDWKISRRNTEYLISKGIPVIPVYHRDEPTELLKEYSVMSKKIGLGGIVRDRKGSDRWIDACFSTIWPQKIHGLGVDSSTMILKYPWHSVDSSQWMWAVMKMCRWKRFGFLGQPKTRSDICLISQIEEVLKLQREAKGRWGKMLATLED